GRGLLPPAVRVGARAGVDERAHPRRRASAISDPRPGAGAASTVSAAALYLSRILAVLGVLRSSRAAAVLDRTRLGAATPSDPRGDRLHPEISAQRLQSFLASEAASLRAAKGRFDTAREVLVDEDLAGVDGLCESEGTRNVACIDSCNETELGTVRE